MSPQQQPYSMPFWDFVQSFDPNQGPGRGVDHNSAPPFPPFMAGYPFGGPGGPGGPHGGPHSGPHGGPHGGPGPHGPHGHGPRGPPPPPDADGFGWGPWFGGAPWGGPRGHHEHHRSDANDDDTTARDTERDSDNEKRDTPDTMSAADVPDPEEVAPEEHQCGRRPHGFGRGRGHGPRGRCGRGGRGGRGGFFNGPRGPPPHHGPGGPHPPPPYPGQGGGFPFDLAGLFRGWAGHPFFRNLREQAGQRFQESDDSDSFTPPVDIFNTEKAFVLHVALPGAKKDDIGVNWDADRSILNIAGVVHRPGDEEFLATLSSGERKVGMFERNVTLPPEGTEERDEVDGYGITAKMEDGVLVVTVPKVEKEWTEIRKVDIE
ncbi:hypothetical protein FDECE_15492 [Fusarium decemcellulare]|nr:hypothetical protein FDECE_15492 [Fusarium decemcellulare]